MTQDHTMRVEQLVYTSCLKGLGSTPGFMIQAVSPGLTPQDCAEVAGVPMLLRPMGLSPSLTPSELAAACPAGLFGRKLQSGRIAVTRRIYAADYSKRPGNSVLHSLVFDQSPRFGLTSLDCWDGWISVAADEPPRLDTLSEADFDKLPENAPATLPASSSGSNGAPLLAAIVDALLADMDSPAPRGVGVKAESSEIGAWIAVVLAALPFELDPPVSFLSYADNVTPTADLRGITPASPSTLEQAGIHVFDTQQIAGRTAPGSSPPSRLTRGWRVFCKSCKRPAPLPEFACGKCGAWHATLRPSRYGIFLRRCTCGARIPCAYITGRNRLQARCPHCKGALNAAVDAESANTIIAFVGAPSAGKSAYLTAAAVALIESYGPSRGWKVSFTNPADQLVYDQLVNDIRVHGVTGKTMDEQLSAFNFLIDNVRGMSKRRQLFLCDVAGESFARSDKLAVQQQMSYATGAVFLLDPFALPDVRRACEAKLTSLGVLSSVSREDPSEVLGRFVNGLEEHHNLKSNDVVRFPLAVIVTKADLCGLRDHLTGDQAIRECLKKWGASQFVSQAETRFRKIRFFAASPLERDSSGKLILTQNGVLPPLVWILSESGDPLAPRQE